MGDKNWGTKQWDDLHKIEAFLRAAITMLRVDKRRVHVSGFSQGGFLTFNLLCRASDVICSIAPIGIPSDGKYVGGYWNGYVLDPSARKHKNCFVNGKGPKVKPRLCINRASTIASFKSPRSIRLLAP